MSGPGGGRRRSAERRTGAGGPGAAGRRRDPARARGLPFLILILNPSRSSSNSLSSCSRTMSRILFSSSKSMRRCPSAGPQLARHVGEHLDPARPSPARRLRCEHRPSPEGRRPGSMVKTMPGSIGSSSGAGAWSVAARRGPTRGASWISTPRPCPVLCPKASARPCSAEHVTGGGVDIAGADARPDAGNRGHLGLQHRARTPAASPRRAARGRRSASSPRSIRRRRRQSPAPPGPLP